MFRKSKDLPTSQFPTQEADVYINSPSLDTDLPLPSKNNSYEKRVDFTDIIQYSDPPSDSFDDDQIQPSKLPTLPPADLRPQKGILKYSHGYVHPSLSSLLVSCMKALAGKDIFSRKDAYSNLSDVLRGYNNVLEPLSIKSSTHELCQHIERDLSAAENNGNLTSSLISPALILVSSLQFNPAVVDEFPLKFRIFMIEYAIKALGDPLTSRGVIRNIMFVIANQDFSPKVMTSERFGRLINVLHVAEENDKRKRIITGRIEIYQNLLKNCKSLMAIHTTWIEDLLCDMISSLKEVQVSAIKLGFEAGVKLGTEYSVSSAINGLLKSHLNDGELYGTVYSRTLMKKSKGENGRFVPQIWSILILFQRHRPEALSESLFLNPLLSVLTHCLNQRNPKTQNEAVYAWNRFIFSIQLSEKTPKSLRDILIRPYSNSLTRQRACHVLPSIFNLLYYAFRPGCPSIQLDIYWDEFVKVLISHSLPKGKYDEKSRQNSDLATQILLNLFDVNSSRKWSENKAVESLGENDITADELPALDSKWLRKNSSRVFPVLLNVMEKLFWDFSDPLSLATKVWKNYISSIASPAAMEVIVSKETMSFILSVITFLYQCWDMGVISLQANQPLNVTQPAQNYLQSLQTIITITVSGLGVHAFMEKILKFPHDMILPIANEYQQLMKISSCKSPIHHLVNMFSRPCPGMEYDNNFIRTIDHILKPFLQARRTFASKLAFLNELCVLLVGITDLTPSKMIFEVLSNYVIDAINSSDPIQNSSNGQIPIDCYESVLKFLDYGVNLSPEQPLSGWCLLYELFSTTVSIRAGNHGRALALIEPLSMTLCTAPHGQSYVGILVSKADYPKEQQELELAQKIIWGEENSIPEIMSLDPYSHLYKYLNTSIISSYISNDQNSDTINSTNTLLKRCPTQLALDVLCRIKDAISMWITDKDSKLNGGPQEEAVALLWLTIITTLNQLMESSDQNEVLHNLESLIYSGIQSKNLRISEMTTQMCNSIFGSAETIHKNFDRLKDALESLRQKTSQTKPFLSSDICTRKETTERHSSEHPVINNCNDDFSRDMTPQFQSEPQVPASDLKKSQVLTPQVVIKVTRTSKSCGKNRPGKRILNRKKRGFSLGMSESSPKTKATDSPIFFGHDYDSQVLKNIHQSEESEVNTISEPGISSKLNVDPGISIKVAVAQNKECVALDFQPTSVASDKNGPVSNSLSSTWSLDEIIKEIEPLSCHTGEIFKDSSVYSSLISKSSPPLSLTSSLPSPLPSPLPLSSPSRASLNNLTLNVLNNFEKQSDLDLTMQESLCSEQTFNETQAQDLTITDHISRSGSNNLYPISSCPDSMTPKSLPSPVDTETKDMANLETINTPKTKLNEGINNDYKYDFPTQLTPAVSASNELELMADDNQQSKNSSEISHKTFGTTTTFLDPGTNFKKISNVSPAAIQQCNELNEDELGNIPHEEYSVSSDVKMPKAPDDSGDSPDALSRKSDFPNLTSRPNSLGASPKSTISDQDVRCELNDPQAAEDVERVLCLPTVEDRPTKKISGTAGKPSCTLSLLKRPRKKTIKETPQKPTNYLSNGDSVDSSNSDKNKTFDDDLDNLVVGFKTDDIPTSLSTNKSSRLRCNPRSKPRKRKFSSDDGTNTKENLSTPLHGRQLRSKRRRITRLSLAEDSVNEIHSHQNFSVDLDSSESLRNKKSINDPDYIASSDNEKNALETPVGEPTVNCESQMILRNEEEQPSLINIESSETKNKFPAALLPICKLNEQKIVCRTRIIDASNDEHSRLVDPIEDHQKNIDGMERTDKNESHYKIIHLNEYNSNTLRLNNPSKKSSANLSPQDYGSRIIKALDAEQPQDISQGIFDSLNFLISALQKTNLNKDTVGLIEDRMMDAKRELYEAERRGRLSN